LCSVSDQLVRGEHLSSDERQEGFRDMVIVALDTLQRADGR